MIKLIVVCYIFVVLSAFSNAEECSSDIKTKSATLRLKQKLLCDYDRTVRPTLNHGNTTNVTMRLLLKHFDYDDHSGSISIHSWIVLTWRDEHLTWDKSQYEGVDRLHISMDEIWIPDIALYNGDDMSGGMPSLNSVTCRISTSGNVVAVIPSRHDALCEPDLTQWPFDKQSCRLRFGSWIHTGEELNINFNKPAVSMADFKENREWFITNYKFERNAGVYNCCPDQTFPSLNYDFDIQRHSATLANTVVMPLIVMMIITILSMFFDPEDPQRIFLNGVGIFAHFVYMDTIPWLVPENGDTCPTILVFYRNSLLLSLIALLLTVIFRSMTTTNKNSPSWLSSFITIMLNNKPGQLLLLTELDPTAAAVTTSGNTEEGNDLVASMFPEKSRSKEWIIFAKLLNKLCIMVYVIIYLSMIFKLLP